LSWNLGASTSWNPQGLSRPVMGLLYLYLLTFTLPEMSLLTAIWRHLRVKISFIVIITTHRSFLCSNVVALLSFPQLAMVLWLGNALTVRSILLCVGRPGWKDVVELVLLQPRLHAFLKLRSQRSSLSDFFTILCAYPLKGDLGEFHCCRENCAFL